MASGKSFAAGILEQLGGATIDADALGHQVLGRPLVARRLAQIFGDDILASDGSVNRQQLAKLVFGNDALATAARRELEELVHPIIHAAAVQELRRLREQEQPPRFVIIDAPLLLEAGWAPLCDAILFIDAPDEIRLARAKERGWTEQGWRDREAAQLSLDEKRKRSTHILPSEPQDELRRRLTRLVEQVANETGKQ